MGCCFDVASVNETRPRSPPARTPDRISYGNTIKKESEIAAAFALGVTLYAVDCEAEVEKVARAAPGSRVICRIHCDGTGSEWPLSRKFGCEPDFADRHPGARPQARARRLRHLVPCRLPAEQRGGLGPGARLHGGDLPRLRRARDLPVHGQSRRRLPGQYVRKTPKLEIYGKAIFRALRRHFGNAIPETIVEPGRGLVGNAGVIEAEVVLIAKRNPEDDLRWVYLDIGKFHGLAETIDESIRYPIRTTARPRRDRALHRRRPDLQLGRRPLREDPLPAAGLARHRRQGADRGGRRLHGDLFVGRLQRLSAAAAIRDLTLGLTAIPNSAEISLKSEISCHDDGGSTAGGPSFAPKNSFRCWSSLDGRPTTSCERRLPRLPPLRRR